jgi:DNA-binding Lrp family transcriptional regulator
MESWWDAIDNEILEHLAAAGPTSPDDLARTLGMSPAAISSCLAMLAADGKVRIRSVEATPPPLARVA